MRIAFRVGGLIGLLFTCAGATAAEPAAQVMWGAEVSGSSSYAYFGHVAPLAGNSLGNGWARRLWLDWSAYRYDGGAETHRVTAPGVELAVGYQKAVENHWAAAYAGLSYRYSRISPSDPSSSVQGGMLRPKFQVEGEQTLSQDWKLGGNASYIVGQRAYWVRGRLLRDIGAGRSIGMEAITQGDPSYRANQLGLLLLGLKAGNSTNVGFKLGARQVEGLSTAAYFGVELGSTF